MSSATARESNRIQRHGGAFWLRDWRTARTNPSFAAALGSTPMLLLACMCLFPQPPRVTIHIFNLRGRLRPVIGASPTPPIVPTLPLAMLPSLILFYCMTNLALTLADIVARSTFCVLRGARALDLS